VRDQAAIRRMEAALLSPGITIRSNGTGQRGTIHPI